MQVYKSNYRINRNIFGQKYKSDFQLDSINKKLFYLIICKAKSKSFFM